MIIIQPKGQNTILPRMESGLHLSLMEKYALFLKAGKKKSNSHEGSKWAKYVIQTSSGITFQLSKQLVNHL